MENNNIILIGMPGSGKSTVGVVLAKRLGYEFVDSDLIIQKTTGKLLHELIEENGIEGFWKIENDVNESLEMEKSIIATGGSAIYGEGAMKHLQEIGTVVYLKISYEELKDRLGDLNERGVTLKPGQSLKDLYDERIPMYEKYAGLTIDCDDKQLWKIVAEIDTRITK
jgi:shikimate kinase